MKILIPTTEFPPAPGGVSAVAYEQAAGLAALGHEVVVETLDFSRYGPHLEPPALHENLTVHYRPVRARSILRVAPLAWNAVRAARRFRPDIVLCPQYRGTGIPAMLAAKIIGAPLALYTHSTEFQTELANPLRRTLARSVLKRASCIFSNSANTRRLLLEWFPDILRDIVTVHPGIHRAALQSDEAGRAGRELRTAWLAQLGLPDTPNTIVLGSLCRLQLQKGIDYVLRAITALPRDTQLCYVIGGTGPDTAQFQQLAAELNIADRVLFIGPIAYPHNTAFFNAIDIFVQPSQPHGKFIESFGISPLEAQACGKPVICTDWGGLPEAVAKDRSGLLIPTADLPALIDAISMLAASAQLRTDMGNAGRTHAQNFGWDMHAAHIERHLKALP